MFFKHVVCQLLKFCHIYLRQIELNMKFSDLHLHWGQCKYKGNIYRSYSLARAYRENGKNRKVIKYKLGKLTEDEVVKWKSLLKSLKNPDAIVRTMDDIHVNKHFAYLDVDISSLS